ncbi:MAG: hypothetical protein ACO3BI_05790, partial [Candidatus Nanopelagicales bacterium]
QAGIEVLLDVVYNHTCEGGPRGPMLSFKGIDNANYYRLADDPQFYFDTTGCSNTLNTWHPQVMQLDGFSTLLGRRDARRWFPI